MRLKPMPAWLRRLIDMIMTPIAMVLLSPLILMLWLHALTDRWFGPRRGVWQLRMVYKPTRLGWDPEGEVVWLEFVERTRDEYGTILYRRPGDTSVKAMWEIPLDYDGIDLS